jgi:hypothetical protein
MAISRQTGHEWEWKIPEDAPEGEYEVEMCVWNVFPDKNPGAFKPPETFRREFIRSVKIKRREVAQSGGINPFLSTNGGTGDGVPA